MTPLAAATRSARPAPSRSSLAVLIGSFALAGAGCECRGTPEAPASSTTAAKSAIRPPSSIPAPSAQPQPRRGMVWVEPGPLVAGTPSSQLPRLADQEMPGEQVMLKGFYIDIFPYPNEEGAIPLTNLDHAAAVKLCAEQGKRLCGELEWERACKGPANSTFEYGNAYRADRCGTGAEPTLRPSGLRVACRSEFGVRDLHGGVFEWTASAWGRSTGAGFMSVRGGNGPYGELSGRCAHAEPRAPETRAATLGFRCCAGEPNTQEVVLDVKRGPKLEAKGVVDRDLARTFLELLPEDARTELKRFGLPRVEMYWIWRPIGNEELHAARICAGLGKQPSCGVLFSRLGSGVPELLGWAESGFVPGSLHIERDSRDIWLLGGDDPGPFKRWVGYAWGKISIGPIERRVPKPTKTRKNAKKVSAPAPAR